VADNYHTALGFPQLLGSSHEKVDDLRLDRAADGTAYGRAFYSSVRDRFTLRHVLTIAQRDALLSFYAAHRTVAIDLTFQADWTTYTGLLFEGPPKFDYLALNRIQATVTMSQR
jgi:hypothetical protein